jgi:hypothetical protein
MVNVAAAYGCDQSAAIEQDVHSPRPGRRRVVDQFIKVASGSGGRIAADANDAEEGVVFIEPVRAGERREGTADDLAHRDAKAARFVADGVALLGPEHDLDTLERHGERIHHAGRSVYAVTPLAARAPG